MGTKVVKYCDVEDCDAIEGGYCTVFTVTKEASKVLATATFQNYIQDICEDCLDNIEEDNHIEIRRWEDSWENVIMTQQEYESRQLLKITRGI